LLQLVITSGRVKNYCGLVQAYDKLQKLGITCSYQTSQKALADMGKAYGEILKKFKEEMRSI